ncbi:MAG: hypothetical protein WA061_01810 [Microgenomates group bacterium]
MDFIIDCEYDEVETPIRIRINMRTRRIMFEYYLSEERDCGFEFSLLSECRDDVQHYIEEMLKDSGIEIMVVEDFSYVYTIVTNYQGMTFEK